MWKSESSQSYENKAQLTDSSKACNKPRAFNCFPLALIHSVWIRADDADEVGIYRVYIYIGIYVREICKSNVVAHRSETTLRQLHRMILWNLDNFSKLGKSVLMTFSDSSYVLTEAWSYSCQGKFKWLMTDAFSLFPWCALIAKSCSFRRFVPVYFSCTHGRMGVNRANIRRK